MYDYQYKDCYLKYDGKKLKIGNNRVERIWLMDGKAPKPQSLYDKSSEKEWLDSSVITKDDLPFFRHTAYDILEETAEYEVSSSTGDDYHVGQEHLKGIILLKYGSLHILWELVIYPELPVIRSCFLMKGYACKKSEQGYSTWDEFTMQKDHTPGENEYIEYLPLHELHCHWKSVSFKAISDYNNNLLNEDFGLLYINERSWLRGNLLFINESMGSGGLIVIKESPTYLEQTAYPGGDFYMKGKSILVTGSGVHNTDLSPDEFTRTYGSAICLWNGGEADALKELRCYHEARHKFNPDLDCMVISNTWGDRSEDKKISESFILSELEIAKKTGITHYQIDLGWAYKSGNPDGNKYIWSIDSSKFPNEFYTLKTAADTLGLKIGLWFRPYSVSDFKTWEEDADVLISMYQKFGITQFKLDGFRIESQKGGENLVRMMQKVLYETGNQVSFNIDITANKRLGFFGQTQYGTLFLENRYTDWSNYYPHFTLRNLWKLSKYIPTYRLLIEFLNVDRCHENYKEDPLAPCICGQKYSFAVTMFSNPLAWFETTGLSEKNMAELNKLITLYRKYQKDILSGLVLPIGDEPDGTRWTGFQSIVSEKEGYLLIIRERNNEDVHAYKFWNELPYGSKKEICITKIAGDGKDRFTVNTTEKIEFEFEKEFSFGLFQYSVVSEQGRSL